MRVIAGVYKGRQIKAPKGSNTRPTLDRVKEAMMSKLVSEMGPFEGVCVLDAYAGSGALGIEALSRGAEYVLFCDVSSEAQRVLSENLSMLEISRAQAKALKIDVAHLVSASLEKVFDLVFLDPPYSVVPLEVLQIMENLYTANILSQNVLLCYELAKTSKPDLFEALDTLKWAGVSQKDYGETTLALIRKDAQ